MRYVKFVVLFLALGLTSIAQAPTLTPAQQQARTMCLEIEKNVNQLAPFTQTSCRAGGGNTPDTISLLIISLFPVWDDADAKRQWLEFVVEGAGATLNANAAAKIDELIVTDPGQLAERFAFGLSGTLVKKLETDFKSGALQKEEMFPLIEKALVKKPINAK